MEASPTGVSGQDLHRLVAEGTPDLQTVVSVDGVYRFVSAAGAASFGWTRSDLLGRPQAEFTHPDRSSWSSILTWAYSRTAPKRSPPFAGSAARTVPTAGPRCARAST